MALQKLITTKFGVSAEYHKVIETRIDWHNKTAMIRVGLFATEEARRTGCSPIRMSLYPRLGEDDGTFPFEIDSPVLASAYAYLKTLDDFVDAIDV